VSDQNKSGEGGEQRQRVDTVALLAGVDIVKVIEAYVPLKKTGKEYEACCPFHTEKTPSFKVNPVKQFYQCFGCGANGDAIGFVKDYKGVSFLDACRELGADVPESGAALGKINPPAALRREPLKAEKPDTVWLPILPVPAHATEPPKAHIKRGLPIMTWCYRDAAGNALGYVYRFKKSAGGKDIVPLTWCRADDDSGKEDWRWVSFPKPRVLYGLDRLAAKPDAAVLIVEGEKCADAGQAELPDLVVVSWPGGCKAEDKVDWSPLAGRKMVMTMADCDAKHVPLTKDEREALPDKEAQALAQADKPLLPEADQPGVKAMVAVQKHLHVLNVPAWSIKIPAPGEKPDGWDIADMIKEGLTGEALAAHLRANVVKVAPPGALDVIDPEILVSKGIYTPPGACASPPEDDDYDQSFWRRMLLRKDGKLVDCRENVYLMLKYHPAWSGVLWADEFAKRIVTRKPMPWQRPVEFVPGHEWDPNDSLRLGLWLAQQERLLIRNEQNLARSVAWVASDNRWHPVREYLDAQVWDGQLRTRDWLTDYLGVKKTEYTMLVGHFFLIGMVARIYRPGCQMRFMPIFEGKQYRGKSSAFRVLGGQWYADTTLDLNNKDVYQVIQGVWLHEIAELDAFSRSDATRIKAFVSSQKDRFRAPYDTVPRDWERQVAFGGSTNQDEYFKDPTGNTRFWPLKCEEEDDINLEGLAGVRDQLFAEAVMLFKQGQRWHPTAKEQQELFEPEQAEREIVDPWQSFITRYLRQRSSPKVTMGEILTDCLKIEVSKIDRAKQQSTSVGTIMKRLGWHKKRETGGDREYYYERPEGWEKVPASTPAEGDEDVPF